VDIEKQNPAIPQNNIIIRNISVGGKWLNIPKIKPGWMIIEDNLIDQDPHFVDPDKEDFRLKQSSPAYEQGFKTIPAEKIGLYKEGYRARLFNRNLL
jgi:hypothetical protein